MKTLIAKEDVFNYKRELKLKKDEEVKVVTKIDHVYIVERKNGNRVSAKDSFFV